MLGGDIVVRSTAGEGSQFTLLLPEDGRSSATEQGATDARVVAEPIVASPAPVTISAPLAPAPAVARRAQIPDDREQLQPGDISILVVEDDGAFARVLADMTRRKGYRVLVATDGESALELARRYRPSGILLDVDLPIMNGWVLMEQLKADSGTRHIPVHFVTANDESTRGLAMGAVGFISSEEHPSGLQSLMRISYAVFCLT